MLISKNKKDKQVKNFNNALKVLNSFERTKDVFEILQALSIQKVSNLHTNKSPEYFIKKWMNSVIRQRGIDKIQYDEFMSASNRDIATFGCVSASRQSLCEDFLEKILEPFDFVKDDLTYIEHNGSAVYEKKGTDKSLDFKHKEKQVYVVAKDINGSGGAQDNEFSEIHDFLMRLSKNKFIEKIIIFCAGDYFSEKRINQINSWIDQYCPFAKIYTDQQNGNYSIEEFEKYLKENFNE